MCVATRISNAIWLVANLNKFVKIQLYIEPAKEYRRNALNVENVPCEIILESHPVTK